MGAVQTSYSERMEKGYAGMIANEAGADVDSRICETSAGITFGKAVGQGTADNGAVLGGAVTIFAGLTVRDPSLLAADADEYQQYANMGVMVKGDMWVATTNAVAAGAAVYYNSTTGVLDDASGGSNVGPVKGAVWMTTGAGSGALAIVRLTGSLSDN